VPPRFHHPHRIVLHRRAQEPETISRPPLGTGYSHELIEVTERVRAGDTESAIMPLHDTLAVQQILNEACERLGVYHTEDSSLVAPLGVTYSSLALAADDATSK
jgi:hypothetical protein